MKERPILFSGPMVRALLAGTKTQTRRVVKFPDNPHPHFGGRAPLLLALDDEGIELYLHSSVLHKAIRCPYGRPGDRLWVRETFAKIDGQTQPWIETDYRATYKHGDRLGDTMGIKKRWTPAIHMPRAASRITLEVTDVRVERLQDITEADAIAEGVSPAQYLRGDDDVMASICTDKLGVPFPISRYVLLWDSLNGTPPNNWNSNPWVWAITFKRLAP